MLLHETNLKAFLSLAFRSANSLKIKAISRRNLPFAWGWVATSIWLYAYFLPMGGFAFDAGRFKAIVGDSPIYFYIMLISGCLIPLFLDGKRFVAASFYSMIIALACFITVLFVQPGILSNILMLLTVPCIGHIFISHVYAFFMVLNNSEKFYSMILAILLPKILMFLKPVFVRRQSGLDPTLILISFIMLTLVCSTYFIKANKDTIPSCQKVKAPIKAYSLMPVTFVIFTLNDVIAPATLQQMNQLTKNKIEAFYFFGILAGLAVILLMQNLFSMNICLMLNLSLAFLVLAFVMDIIHIQYPHVGLVSAVCFGIAYSIGIVNIYYLTGFMIKKFKSSSFYRFGILFSTLYYLGSSLFVQFISRNGLIISSILMAFVSIFIVILFFIMSPLFIKMLYSGEWIDDAYRSDVTQCSRLEAKMKDYKLTNAEMEVCRLLLEGYTLRQISGIVSKAYATINTYCTSIYRKMNINSRTELLQLLQEYRK